MLLSCLLFHNYNKKNIENFSLKNKNIINYDIYYYILILFFIMELILFYYSMIITMKCSKSKEAKIINTILSLTFTTPFIFFMMLSNPCATDIFLI